MHGDYEVLEKIGLSEELSGMGTGKFMDQEKRLKMGELR